MCPDTRLKTENEPGCLSFSTNQYTMKLTITVYLKHQNSEAKAGRKQCKQTQCKERDR